MNILNTTIAALSLILLLSACGGSQAEQQIADHFSNEELAYPVNLEQGKKLMESKCYVCHNPKLTEEQMIAPPMVAIKNAYMTEDFAEFLSAMKNWLDHPYAAISKMPEAIEKYGIMPKQQYAAESIELIANYLFRAPVEEPVWWRNKSSKLNTNKEREVLTFNSIEEKGLHFATTTKQVLGKNLMGTIQKQGTLAALAFCNEAAYPLTDSMSVVHQAKIKRVSDKPRNPNNAANETELKYIKIFKNLMAAGKEVHPIVETAGGTSYFYYPIETNSMCLQCHGTPEKEIKSDVMSALAKRYPLDKAIGYTENQVRGIWSIQFDTE